MSSSVFSSWTFWMTLAALWMIVVSVAGMMWLVVGEQKQKKTIHELRKLSSSNATVQAATHHSLVLNRFCGEL
jgi:hypothetical protein